MIRLGRGKWKGHILRPSSRLCRPTSSLLRGALMDIAGSQRIQGNLIWDLCSGSGAVGLEALSWGAEHCVFVDRNRRCSELTREFLRKRNAMDSATVITGDFRRYITGNGSEPDLIFIDPPYRSVGLYSWIQDQDWSSVLGSRGVIFVECGDRNILDESWNIRSYGESILRWKYSE